MGDKHTAGQLRATDKQQQAAIPLSVSAFAAICKQTTEAGPGDTPADTTSDAGLLLLKQHGDAGGVVSMQMAAEMKKRGVVAHGHHDVHSGEFCCV